MVLWRVERSGRSAELLGYDNPVPVAGQRAGREHELSAVVDQARSVQAGEPVNRRDLLADLPLDLRDRSRR